MSRKPMYDSAPRRLSVTLPDSIDFALRYEALKRRILPSQLIAEWVAEKLGTTLDNPSPVRVLEGELQDEKKARKVRRKNVEPPTLTEQEKVQAESYAWTWDRLQEAFAQISGGKRMGLATDLAKYLRTTNISVWKKSGVPQRWWLGITTWAKGKGWNPPQEQGTIFDME